MFAKFISNKKEYQNKKLIGTAPKKLYKALLDFYFMEGKLEKNDFIELEFIGRIKDTNEVFDTNIEEEAKKLNLDFKSRPLIVCLGQNMTLPAIDDFLIGKPIGDYKLELKADKAFGLRRRELLKTMPVSVFSKQNINPQAGMVFSFDNMLGKITAVSGGRVIVDFNNPMAGKDVIYELKVKRKVDDEKEKVKALMFVFFGKELKYEIKERKLIIEADKGMDKFILLFSGKFKEILNLDLETSESKDSEGAQKLKISDIKEKEEKSEEKKEEKVEEKR